ncbi:hypothetical protein DFA_09938 [Cavenderia fasciculata]|uniref:Uncharacterized protein n=1 Tax=Cavenderia fasciculata TaxID=261658 RepID=F4Q8U5_CACFS|nr:uncharacterized protein DFA_09938 [Cavenderia fasciculata]EGG15114.1 hypothetical protein DFA_09938 [Cavenderia fasciculata]|eukprot:XP_004351834.1 hypothetical protein DFA_09938 [Cavenderia fasciculata]
MSIYATLSRLGSSSDLKANISSMSNTSYAQHEHLSQSANIVVCNAQAPQGANTTQFARKYWLPMY